jgi:chromosome segregation ATPase
MANQAGEQGQILHLKQLLVTLKQQYEKNLYALNEQLQQEIAQKHIFKKELDQTQVKLQNAKQHSEEELTALHQQQIVLKELLKKRQDELKESLSLDSSEDQQRIEQLERMIPYWRKKAEDAYREQELAQSKIKSLQEELLQKQISYQKQVDELQQALTDDEQRIQQGIHPFLREVQLFESRYVALLNEKVTLENRCKTLQEQVDDQISNVIALNEQREELEKHDKMIEASLHEKEAILEEHRQIRLELEKRLMMHEGLDQEKQWIQERYEQLKEEWIQLSDRLDEALNHRIQVEFQINQLQEVVQLQELQLKEQNAQLADMNQEKMLLQTEMEQTCELLEENENRLKVAQQHLAKKVKEVTLLNEKVDEQLTELINTHQSLEIAKTQIHQLQGSLELYQKQEKRLQEQLHEALKGTESQVAKWEKQYFLMYDKWQESENRNRELKKFEEKHLQMQNLLANLGTFMGTSLGFDNALLQSTSNLPHFYSSDGDSSIQADSSTEEKYDLFGMRQDQFKPNSFK